MKTFSLSVIAVAAGLAWNAQAVMAADLKGSPRKPAPVYVEPAPVLPLWTGLYIGGSLGYTFSHVDHFYDRQNNNNDHGPAEMNASGFNLALHAGYNWQMPNLFVFGIEAELGSLGLDTQRIVIKDDDVLRIKTGMYGSLRGRLGYALGRFMPYVTAGIAFVDIENAGGNPANANRFHTVDESRYGLAVGAGAEYAFTDRLFARLEYLYIDTPEFETRNLENEKMRFNNDIHLVRAGLSYKF